MTDQLRALLMDLADELNRYHPLDADAQSVLTRARAALAQPAPDGPTAQQLADTFVKGCRDGSKAGEPPFLGGARAVLARWGNTTPQPVPVSERLPGPEDCNAERECWTTDYDPSLVYSPVWKMTELPRQNLGHDFSNAYFWRNVRFWLPAHALPLPAGEVQ